MLPPGEGQKLEDKQVSLERVCLLSLGVKGHRLGGVQGFGHLSGPVQDLRETSRVEVGQGTAGAAGEGAEEDDGG